MNDQDTIDLGQVKKIILRYRFKFIGIICITTLIALAAAFLLPKQYESTVLLRAKAQNKSGISLQAAAALSFLGGGNVQSPAQVYMEMMKSRSVLDPVIAQLDLPDKDKEKLDNKEFAKKYLKITNTKGTDLIEVAATGRSPEEARQIAAGVVSSFQHHLTKLNQSDQSLMMQFLKGRLDVAKQEMEQAEQNLEAFRQQEKVYVPDEQTKASIKKLTEYDQKIAQLQVQNEANQTKLNSVNDQLAKQNTALAQYNVADNQEVQKLRSAIVDKQLALMELQQRYTDKHPSVILAQQEVDTLTNKLQEQVSNAIASGATLTPVQSGLLQAKVQTETELLVGKALLSGLQHVQKQNEQEISKLSADSLTYIGLERQVNITQEVYTALVKNYEQTRIQEAMESMDIQIVDEANLPNKPSAPKKLLITAIGGVCGIIFAFVYLVILYSRFSRADNMTASQVRL